MIDLHSHILPGLDDGARSLPDALDMARLAVESGVRAMVATPHCAGDRAREVRYAYNILRQALREENIPLRLLLGMEIFGTRDTAYLLRQGGLLTLNGSRYPLIEFDFGSDGEAETLMLQKVIQAGYTPIVAHPERYGYVQEDPALLNLWKRMGCVFQVNRGSLLGRFGMDAQQMGFALVERGFAAVIASDAHSARMRTPWMRDVQELIGQEFSPFAADYLLRDNPLRIIKNEKLPPAEPEWF